MITPFIRRLATKQVSTGIGTKQVTYTVPAHRNAVITHVVLRGVSATLATIVGTMSLGFNSSANDWSPAYTQAELRTLTANNKILLKTNDVTVVTGAAAGTFGVIFSNTALTANVQIDVFGYLFSV